MTKELSAQAITQLYYIFKLYVHFKNIFNCNLTFQIELYLIMEKTDSEKAQYTPTGATL